MAIISRRFWSESDYERIRRFLVAIQPLVGTRIYCTIGELDWWRFTENHPDISMSLAQLWDKGGEVAAFAWPSDELIAIVLPDYAFLQDQVVGWCAKNHWRRVTTSSADTPLAYASDHARQDSLLCRKGAARKRKRSDHATARQARRATLFLTRERTDMPRA